MTKEKNDMTNEHNFKVGDKVATTKPYDIAINGNTTTMPIGEVGVIENIDGEKLLVDFPEYYCALTLMASDVEPIQPLDRRTAFLTRLQSLLREFDATIEINPYYETAACLSLWLNKECAFKNKEARMITADNIMDFDKE